MRLLDLPAPVQRQVIEQKLSMGHARALIGAPDCENLARTVEAKGLSVRDTEQLVRRAKKGDGAPGRKPPAAARDDGRQEERRVGKAGVSMGSVRGSPGP